MSDLHDVFSDSKRRHHVEMQFILLDEPEDAAPLGHVLNKADVLAGVLYLTLKP